MWCDNNLIDGEAHCGERGRRGRTAGAAWTDGRRALFFATAATGSLRRRQALFFAGGRGRAVRVRREATWGSAGVQGRGAGGEGRAVGMGLGGVAAWGSVAA
jgi:hypothetical protein